jgi:hypothetical protein
MTRREVLCDVGRLALLRWRLVRGRVLPGVVMLFLKQLDAWALVLQQRGRR